jgi:hypothetical protein
MAFALFPSELKKERRMPQRRFKLNASAAAILSECNQRTTITIPANALVTLEDGDAEGNGFVRVRFEDKILSMFAFDLRTRGERVWGQSA